MPLYLVRHAKAGERREWSGDDDQRPLSTAGWKQAERLAARLARAEPSVLVSSPYVRCVQTLEPLATLVGEQVSLDARLGEGARFEDALALLHELPDASVLCSHGDVIPTTIEALVRRGLEVRSAPDWRKASVWVLHRNGRLAFTRAKVWPPPGR